MALQSKPKITYGTLPAVDLLPEAQRAERVHRATVPRLISYIVVSAILAGVIWVAGAVPVYLANQRLSLAELEAATLSDQIAQYPDEQKALGAVARLTAERQKLTVGEILFAEFLDEIDGALPKGAEVTGYTGILPSKSEEPTPEEFGLDLNPLCIADTATITVTFDGKNLDSAPPFLSRLEKLEGVKCLVGTRIVEGVDGKTKSVVAQLALTEDALANRFKAGAE